MKFIFSFFLFIYSVIGLASQVDSYQNIEYLLEQSLVDSADNILESMDIENSTNDQKIVYYLFCAKSKKMLGQFENALINLNSALNLARENSDENYLAECYINFAEYYRARGKIDIGLEWINKVTPLVKNGVCHDGVVAKFYNRFAALISENRNDTIKIDLIPFLNQSVHYSRRAKDLSLMASSLNQLAFYYETHDLKKAEVNYLKSLAIYEKINNERYAAGVCTNLSRLYNKWNKWDESESYAKEALEYSYGRNWGFSVLELYLYLRNCAIAKGDYQNGLLYADSFYNLRYVENENSMKARLIDLESKIELTEAKKALEESEDQKVEVLEDLEKITKTSILLSGVLLLILIVLAFGVLYYKKVKKLNVQLDDANSALQNEVDKKNVLMMELHHRVKNNLTFLKSLIFLQGQNCESDAAKSILKECELRIESMALVHQNLYDSEDLSRVNFNEFIEQLLAELEFYRVESEASFSVIKNIEAVKIDLSSAILFGLIINELITNSIKYAFKGSSLNNEIHIDILRRGNSIELNYFDNGVGFPSNFSFESPIGFGSKLIGILIKQLEGESLILYENNSSILIKAPIF